MKSLVAIVLSVFAVTAVANAPAKKEEAKPAASAPAAKADAKPAAKPAEKKAAEPAKK